MKKVYVVFGIVLVLAAAVGIFVLNGRRSTGNTGVKGRTVQASDRSITLDEIARHSDQKSCWMTIEGKVYDVTSYIPGHPGGQMMLLGCGKDATQMFNSRPNDGTSHSGRARQMLAQFQIGVLGN